MRDYTRVSVISKYMIILLECFSIYRVIQNTFNNSCFNLNFRSDEEIVMRIGNLTLSPIPPPPNSYIIKSSTIVHCNKTCIGFLGAKGPLQIIYTLCTSSVPATIRWSFLSSFCPVRDKEQFYQQRRPENFCEF